MGTRRRAHEREGESTDKRYGRQRIHKGGHSEGTSRRTASFHDHDHDDTHSLTHTQQHSMGKNPATAVGRRQLRDYSRMLRLDHDSMYVVIPCRASRVQQRRLTDAGKKHDIDSTTYRIRNGVRVDAAAGQPGRVLCDGGVRSAGCQSRDARTEPAHHIQR